MPTGSIVSIRSEPRSWADLLSFPRQPLPLSEAGLLSSCAPITYEALAAIPPSGPSGLFELFTFNSNILLPAREPRRNLAKRPGCELELLLAETRASRSLAEVQALVAENWNRGELGSALAKAVVNLYSDATCMVFIQESFRKGYELSGMHSGDGLNPERLAPLIEDLRYAILRRTHSEGEPIRLPDLNEYCQMVGEGLFLPEDLLMYIIPSSAVNEGARTPPPLCASLVLLAPWDCHSDSLALDTLLHFTSILTWQLERIRGMEKLRGL